MKRREFITLLGGAAAAWPLAARAQQPAMPVIGFLSTSRRRAFRIVCAAFREGLREAGYSRATTSRSNSAGPRTGLNGCRNWEPIWSGVKCRSLWPAAGPPAALAAKAANTTIPVVFGIPEDPVELGLVASLSRPGGNYDRRQFLFGEVLAKRLGLLREVVPTAKRIAMLVNPGECRELDCSCEQMEQAAAGDRAANPRLR